MLGKAGDEHVRNLAYCKESAGIIDGEQIQFIFHIFLGCRTNKTIPRSDEWIRQGKGHDGQKHVRQKLTLHGAIFIGMMSEIPISSLGPIGGYAQLL